MTHYDDESLFQYVEGSSPIASEIESHLSACGECATEIGEHRELIATLGEEQTWQPQEPAPRQFIVNVIAFAQRARLEDEQAVAQCDQVLTGPASWWRQRMRNMQGVYTGGMVKQLLERMRSYIESSPASALQVTALAHEIADALDVSQYPCDYVIKLRAQALRDHAYVLSFMGRYPEALQFADKARFLFDQTPLPEYDLARLAVVKATILRRIDRSDEAVALTRQAAETFLRFGDRQRFVNTRMTEAAIVLECGAIDQALAIWQALETDPAVDALGRVRLAHNIAICYTELQQPAVAAEYFQRCVAEFEMLGMETERTRSRWGLAQALVASGNSRQAIPIQRQTWREFEQLDMVADAGLAALELAEALLAVGEAAEVPAICRDLITRFTQAGMASRAVTALSFLREAVAIGQATPSLVRHVHAFLRELPPEQPRLFAAPPMLGE